MKKFIKLIAIFTGLLILFAVSLDLFISYRLRHSELRIHKAWSGVYDKDKNYDIIINGGSRAWVQYSPAIIDSVLGTVTYNMGIDGSSSNRQIAKYNVYCRTHNGRPKLLIQNVDFATIGNSKDLEREQFFPYFFYDRTLLEEIDKYEHFSWLEKNLPLYRYYGYRDVILSAFQSKHDIALERGYCGRDECWNGSMFAQQKNISVASDSTALAQFDAFISEVLSSGTDVIFVYAPIYSEVNEKCDINKMYDMFGKIASKYDIPILNYNEIEMCNDTNMFYNATHLNRTGAEIFSRMLAEDLDSLICNGVIMTNYKTR